MSQVTRARWNALCQNEGSAAPSSPVVQYVDGQDWQNGNKTLTLGSQHQHIESSKMGFLERGGVSKNSITGNLVLTNNLPRA